MYKTLSKNLSRGGRETNMSEETRIVLERKDRRVATIASLHLGKIFKGVVRKKNDHGYVVDIGEVSGSVLTDNLLQIGSSHSFEVIEICLNNKGNTCTKLALIDDNFFQLQKNKSLINSQQAFEIKPFANLMDLLKERK